MVSTASLAKQPGGLTARATPYFTALVFFFWAHRPHTFIAQPISEFSGLSAETPVVCPTANDPTCEG